MAVPTRPVEGAPVDVTWGQLAHDVAVGPVGLEGYAAAITAGSGTFIPLLTRGRGSMIVGTDVIVPFDGLWDIRAYMAATPGANVIWRGFINVNQSGSFAGVAHSTHSAPAAGWGQATSLNAVTFLSAGKAIRFTYDGSASITANMARFSVIYRGADWT